MHPFNLDSVAYENLGYVLIYGECSFLNLLAEIKKAYENIQGTEKSPRKVALNSSIILDLNFQNNSYIGIREFRNGRVRPFINEGIEALKRNSEECGEGHYKCKDNIFLLYKKDSAERANLFIKVE